MIFKSRFWKIVQNVQVCKYSWVWQVAYGEIWETAWEQKLFLNLVGCHKRKRKSCTDFSKRKTIKRDKWLRGKKSKEKLRIRPSFVFSLLQSLRLRPNDYSCSAWTLPYKNIRCLICRQRERNCFWAAGTTLNTSLSFSQAWLMLPVFLDSWSHLWAQSLKSRAVRQGDTVLSPLLPLYPQPSRDSSSPLPSLNLPIQRASMTTPPLFWQVQ